MTTVNDIDAWLQVNCWNLSEAISCLQMRLNHGLPCLWCDVGGLSQGPSKTQINRWTQRSVAGDLGQEPINKAVKSFTLWLKRCTKSGGEQLGYTRWLSNVRQTVYCVVSVMPFCCVLAQTFSTHKNRRWIKFQELQLRKYLEMDYDDTDNSCLSFWQKNK